MKRLHAPLFCAKIRAPTTNQKMGTFPLVGGKWYSDSMNDPAMLDSPTTSGADPQSLSALEGRVHRLEEAVAALQDTHLMEERIVEKLRGEALRGEALHGEMQRGGPQAKVGPAPPDNDKVRATPPSPAPPHE